MESSETAEEVQASAPPPKAAGTERWWVVIALIVALIALLSATVAPAILAPRGPIAVRSDYDALPSGLRLEQAPGCTSVANTTVTITVPSAGTIVVTASGRVIVNHTGGIEDTVGIFLANAPGQCTYPYAWIGDVSAALPTDPFVEMAYSVTTVFTVSRGGTFSLYLNGHMWWGGDSMDRLLTASVVAVFYPS